MQKQFSRGNTAFWTKHVRAIQHYKQNKIKQKNKGPQMRSYTLYKKKLKINYRF